MPFKNKQQQAACFFLKSKGKNGSWDCDKWAKETNQKTIPKKSKKKKK